RSVRPSRRFPARRAARRACAVTTAPAPGGPPTTLATFPSSTGSTPAWTGSGIDPHPRSRAPVERHRTVARDLDELSRGHCLLVASEVRRAQVAPVEEHEVLTWPERVHRDGPSIGRVRAHAHGHTQHRVLRDPTDGLFDPRMGGGLLVGEPPGKGA